MKEFHSTVVLLTKPCILEAKVYPGPLPVLAFVYPMTKEVTATARYLPATKGDSLPGTSPDPLSTGSV
jgi:hypothetical protein